MLAYLFERPGRFDGGGGNVKTNEVVCVEASFFEDSGGNGVGGGGGSTSGGVGGNTSGDGGNTSGDGNTAGDDDVVRH